jgi:Ca-activated chloride channel homolog
VGAADGAGTRGVIGVRKWEIVIVAAIVLVIAAILFPCFFLAKEKARQPASRRYATEGHAMAKGGPDYSYFAERAGTMAYKGGGAPSEAAPPGATMPASQAARPPDRNAYVTSTYMGGRGERDRLVKLIENGVLVNGKQVKLEAFSAQYTQSFSIPTQSALNLTADTERGKVLTSGGKTYLQVGLQGIKREAPRRPPLNMCLVIDRSGSMAQEGKIENARSAAVQVVGRMAPSDTIAAVAYDTHPTVLVAARKADAKPAIQQKIRALETGNTTDIHAALQAGYKEVRRNLDPQAINEVILLSDGNVTSGIADPSAFARLTSKAFDDGIQTTTIGMGLDYDEQLMMTVAREGKGNYHFVNDAASIRDILQEELEDLTHVVAKALRLRVLLARDIQLVRVLGSQQMTADEVAAAKSTERKIDQRVYRDLGITEDRQHIEDEPGLKVVIPQFYMGDSHVVLLEVKVPAGKRTTKVADVYLKYKDIVFRQNREVQTAVSIGRAGSGNEMVASIRQPVKKNLLGFQTGEVLQQAAALIQGDRAGEAAKKIDEQMVVLGVAAKEWKDPELDRDGTLLAAYRDVIAGMGTQYAEDRNLGEYLAKSLTYAAYQRTQ